MAAKKQQTNANIEISAIGTVYEALKSLEEKAQRRVLDYVANMLGLGSALPPPARTNDNEFPGNLDTESASVDAKSDALESSVDGAEGISPIALKWMKRSGLSTKDLAKLFSLGGDEIDLVAKDVPGKSVKGRARNVILLKGMAAYLGAGAARITHDQIKEACIHYKAFDSTNFATHLKSIAAEVSGNKESGFSLTARGMASATEVIQEALHSK